MITDSKRTYACLAPVVLDNSPAFDPSVPGFSEAYYIIWADPATQRTMVVRYVLFNGPDASSQLSEVWCWYRDRVNGDDFAIRQRYPLRAVSIGEGALDLRIGTECGLTEERAWGVVEGLGRVLRWDYAMPSTNRQPVDRLRGASGSVLFPRFYSNGCRRILNLRLMLDGRELELRDVVGTDGHYWNTHHLRTWSWANAVRFRQSADLFLEAIAFRLHAEDAPMAVSVALGDSGWVWQNEMLEAMYFNREQESQLEYWRLSAEYGVRRIECEVTGDPDDMILITHPLPNGTFLYTTITLDATLRIEVIDTAESGQEIRSVYDSEGGVSFEVTKPIRNPRVTREFHVIPAPSRLLGAEAK